MIWLSLADYELRFARLLNGRQVSCFGLGMVALDIRQESTRHTDALDAITTHLGMGSYKCRPRSCIRQHHPLLGNCVHTFGPFSAQEVGCTTGSKGWYKVPVLLGHCSMTQCLHITWSHT